MSAPESSSLFRGPYLRLILALAAAKIFGIAGIGLGLTRLRTLGSIGLGTAGLLLAYVVVASVRLLRQTNSMK